MVFLHLAPTGPAGGAGGTRWEGNLAPGGGSITSSQRPELSFPRRARSEEEPLPFQGFLSWRRGAPLSCLYSVRGVGGAPLSRLTSASEPLWTDFTTTALFFSSMSKP